MIDLTLTPVQRDGVRLEEIDDETVVYERSGRRATYLNETATVIWKLCDGERTGTDILALLKNEFPEAAAEIERDVSDAIGNMAAARVLTLEKRNTVSTPP